VLAVIGARSIAENAVLDFTVTATDPDFTTPTLSAAPLPAGASFVDHANGTATFNWTPGFTQAGVYNVLFIASDGVSADSEQVAITVTNTNRVPLANAGSDQFDLPEGHQVQLNGGGSSDADGELLTYAWLQVSGPVITLSSTTSATPTFTPNTLGTYTFQLIVFDGIDHSVPDTVALVVVNGAPPQAISNLTVRIVADALDFTWSPVTLDTAGLATTIDHYEIHRGTSAYFTPGVGNLIGTTNAATTVFTDKQRRRRQCRG